MNTILTSVLDNLHQAITESHATISHDELPLIVVNQSQWVQLLQNLIANAIKFCGQKPVLIHVGVRSEKNQWVFSVADQGIGIEPQYFERIFELFKRLHSRSEYGGTGVGLALCSKIVSRHGGNLWVESVFGQGTTFFFSLPTNR
jgi:two-component system sensor histidine kinase/response regulator